MQPYSKLINWFLCRFTLATEHSEIYFEYTYTHVKGPKYLLQAIVSDTGINVHSIKKNALLHITAVWVGF